MSAPICMSPLSMRSAPNQSTATLEMLMTSMTVGNISAISRPTASETSVSSAFAVPYRACSCSSRTKARMTRMPVICSRTTWFIRSMRSCIVRNSGRICQMMAPTTKISTGTMTKQRGRQRHVLAQRQDDAADTHDRRGHHQREGQQHQHLDLLDVVGGPGDQRRRAEVPDLLGREVLHPAEDARAHVAAERHRRPGSKVDGGDRAGDLHQRDRQHHPADAHDVAGVALDHAIVDDVRVQRGQVQGRERLRRTAAQQRV